VKREDGEDRKEETREINPPAEVKMFVPASSTFYHFPMTWIDDDRQELERQHQAAADLRARESQIASHAATIYEGLWKEIFERLREAESKGMGRILTNGAQFEQVCQLFCVNGQV
jgi:hypothetical protein